jgi:hypothetical protein
LWISFCMVNVQGISGRGFSLSVDKWNELGGTQRAVQPMPQGIAPGTEGW